MKAEDSAGNNETPQGKVVSREQQCAEGQCAGEAAAQRHSTERKPGIGSSRSGHRRFRDPLPSHPRSLSVRRFHFPFCLLESVEPGPQILEFGGLREWVVFDDGGVNELVDVGLARAPRMPR